MNARRHACCCGLAVLLAVALVGARSTHAYTQAGKASAEVSGEGVEHTVIVGVGGAGELELGDQSLHPGVNLMVEWDAIENWLELEVGASILTANHGAEVPIDLLVKKPFRLARWAEFMVGVGPELVQITGPGRGTFFGGELALDFMFWPWGRRVGLWVEPEYDLVFHGGAASGIGATGGVLFGW